MDLLGIHHLTAISASIRDNHHFYTQTLGMRLVKRSVNQDDVSAYHLFYSDRVGTPGNDLTFFDWPAPPEKRGTRSIIRTSLRVAGLEAVEWWSERLAELGVRADPVRERDGRATLDFEDPEGQRLSLVDDSGSGLDPVPWERSTVPSPYQVRGLGPILLSVPDVAATERLLTGVLNMRPVRHYASSELGLSEVHVYEMGQGGAAAELHVASEPNAAIGRQGAGGVHHVALRTPTEDEYHAWTERLDSAGIPNSGEVDRFWFRSLYFREPNGILFEIATDGPGFGVDEDIETLGEKVVLPPFLERHREQIVRNLKPID
jgi:glyoxalase family protein